MQNIFCQSNLNMICSDCNLYELLSRQWLLVVLFIYILNSIVWNNKFLTTQTVKRNFKRFVNKQYDISPASCKSFVFLFEDTTIPTFRIQSRHPLLWIQSRHPLDTIKTTSRHSYDNLQQPFRHLQESHQNSNM